MFRDYRRRSDMEVAYSVTTSVVRLVSHKEDVLHCHQTAHQSAWLNTPEDVCEATPL